MTKTLTKSPISALFLLKFDVHAGYTIEWSKTVDSKISLKGLEFKSLPSGLHQTSRDVIAFVEDQDDGNSYPDKLLYGVSVFNSNLGDDVNDRADVKMYSLGLLIDPETYFKWDNTKTTRKHISMIWKPLIFTSGWEYIDDLEKLLAKWLSDPSDGLEKYKLLEVFYNSNKIQNTSNNNNNNNSLTISDKSDDKISISSLASTTAKYHQSHHMLLSLTSLLENFGPLIFKIWKLSLLRKKIIIHNACNVELNCSFSYCISVISTIPQEILPGLVSSGVENFEDLQYYQPLYNIGVNDINYLDTIIKKFNPGFIASTTDEILLYKQFLYDCSVKLPSKDSSQPEIISSTDFPKNSPLLKATQRDLRRFKILYDEFDLYLEQEDENYCIDDNLNWWLDVSEPTSWKEYIWKGLSWWATLGENDRANHDFEIDKEGLDNISTFNDQDSIYTNATNSVTVVSPKPTPGMLLPLTASANSEISKEIVDVLKIVGYFQNMTVKIFQVLIDVLNNHTSEDSEETEQLKDDIVYISLNDINEMGLDPYSTQDHEFVVELVKLWWKKEAKIGNYLGNICC